MEFIDDRVTTVCAGLEVLDLAGKPLSKRLDMDWDQKRPLRLGQSELSDGAKTSAFSCGSLHAT